MKITKTIITIIFLNFLLIFIYYRFTKKNKNFNKNYCTIFPENSHILGCSNFSFGNDLQKNILKYKEDNRIKQLNGCINRKALFYR